MAKLGLVSISFRNHSPREVLAAAKAAGLSCIEWGSDVHAPVDKAAEIAALTKEYGMECCSYGTYFRLGVTPMEELAGYLKAAKTLGTDIVRLWCGNKDSEKHTLEEKEALFAQCRQAAQLAQKHGVILCLECHRNTYTNCQAGAEEVLAAVNSPHFCMYWQPNHYISEEANIAYANAISYCVKVIHVFNWKEQTKSPLKEAVSQWQRYLGCFDAKLPLLLEFMPDNCLDSLGAEADALREIVNQ